MADDWFAEYEAKKAQEQAQAGDRIRLACPLLERLGVEKVTVEYDGMGDSGSIEAIFFDPEPAAGIPDGLDDTIKDAAYDFLPSGWEINEGSFGTLAIEVREKKITRDHSWRVVATESEQHNFEL